MSCPACGHANPERAKFCGECGTALGARCPSCGSELPPAAKFCPECGRALGPKGARIETRIAAEPSVARKVVNNNVSFSGVLDGATTTASV